MTKEQKYELLMIAYNNAFAKYSNFQVGALVITKDGKYFIGSTFPFVSTTKHLKKSSRSTLRKI